MHTLLSGQNRKVTRITRSMALMALLSATHPGAVLAAQSQPLVEALRLYWNGEYAATLEQLAPEAITTFELGEQVEAHKYRASSLIALGRTDDARAEFTELLAIDPGHALDPAVAPPKVIEQFEQSRSAFKTESFERGKELYEKGEYVDADKALADALAIDSGFQLAGEYRKLCQAHIDLDAQAAKLNPAPVAVQTAPGPDPEEERIYSLTSDMVQPELERRVNPRYPELDRKWGNGGRVILNLLIDKKGDVKEANILRSVNARIDAAAVRAARAWKYRPARREGKAVSVYKVAVLDFVP
jgi:TonB family protein